MHRTSFIRSLHTHALENASDIPSRGYPQHGLGSQALIVSWHLFVVKKCFLAINGYFLPYNQNSNFCLHHSCSNPVHAMWFPLVSCGFSLIGITQHHLPVIKAIINRRSAVDDLRVITGSTGVENQLRFLERRE